MRVFLAELAAAHGSVAGYVTGYLGLRDSVISDLRARYLTG